MNAFSFFRFFRDDGRALSLESDALLFAGQPFLFHHDNGAWLWDIPGAVLAEPEPMPTQDQPDPIAPAPQEIVVALPEIVVAAPVAIDPPLPPMPPEAPPLPDLFEQYAALFADFDGELALAELLQSEWAQSNDWTAAGQAPLF